MHTNSNNIEEMIKILCVKKSITMSDIARLLNTSPQAFSQRVKRGSLTPSDLKQIALAVNCDFEMSFILSDDDKIVY